MSNLRPRIQIRDRIVEGANRFRMQDLGGGRVELTPDPDRVVEQGTAVNAALMQKWEDAANSSEVVSGFWTPNILSATNGDIPLNQSIFSNIVSSTGRFIQIGNTLNCYGRIVGRIDDRANSSIDPINVALSNLPLPTVDSASHSNAGDFMQMGGFWTITSSNIATQSNILMPGMWGSSAPAIQMGTFRGRSVLGGTTAMFQINRDTRPQIQTSAWLSASSAGSTVSFEFNFTYETGRL